MIHLMYECVWFSEQYGCLLFAHWQHCVKKLNKKLQWTRKSNKFQNIIIISQSKI